MKYVVYKKLFANSVFSGGSLKRRAILPMSTSLMSRQIMARIIFLFTLMTGTVYSLIKDKPNTYWSKRTGNTKFSNFIEKNSQNNSKGTEINRKKLMEYQRHEEKRNILRQSDEILPLPFSRLTTLIRQMENVMHDMNMD